VAFAHYSTAIKRITLRVKNRHSHQNEFSVTIKIQLHLSARPNRKIFHTMLIVMKSGATEEEISRVATVIREMGFRPHVMPGATRTAIGLTGNQGAIDPVQFENLPGVAEAIRVSKP